MDKRYQVFISSTYEDLKEERKELIENLLNLKYLPSGMEMFSASNEEQFKYIKKIIDAWLFWSGGFIVCILSCDAFLPCGNYVIVISKNK